MRLLYVEDEESLAKGVKRGMEREGFAVDWAPDGEEALFFADNCPYDMILMDRILPKMEGLDVLRALRKKGNQTPVIMLTAMGSVEEKVKCLREGADDYLVKPFSFDELLVRIQAVMRRGAGLSEDRVEFNGLVVDLGRHWVLRDHQPVELTAKEFSLLKYLIHNRDRVISRTELIEHLYDESFDKDSNLIDVFIHKLRRKIDQDASRKLIHTVRGTGYILTDNRADLQQK